MVRIIYNIYIIKLNFCFCLILELFKWIVIVNFFEDEFPFLDDARLIQGQKVYQKNRDLSAIITVALYILNIVEANVDAHLIQFNVNDNLTFRPNIQQNEINNKQNLGLAFTYKF